jgi:hypothetical protein
VTLAVVATLNEIFEQEDEGAAGYSPLSARLASLGRLGSARCRKGSPFRKSRGRVNEKGVLN